MILYQASSCSSTPLIDMGDMSEQSDYVISTHEGCLDDVVYDCTWSAGDPWVFGGASYSASVYFDVVPEKEKQKILL